MTADRAETEVLASFDALVDALSRQRDAGAAVACFAGDADAVMCGSAEDEVAIGGAAIGALLHARMVAAPEPFEFRWERRQVRICDDVAWVSAFGHAYDVEPGQEPRRAEPYRVTAVLVRRGDAWRCHTFSGAEPTPA